MEPEYPQEGVIVYFLSAMATNHAGLTLKDTDWLHLIHAMHI